MAVGVKLPSALDLRFSAAEKFFAKKVTLTKAEFETLRAEAQVYAFTVAHISSIQILADVRKEVERAIIEGTSFADFQKAMTNVMAKHGWSGLTPWHTETVFRTNVQMAYGIGQLEGLQGTEDAFPYWEYSAINDSRVRPSHFALNGRIYPANHPFWRTHFPPWDYNCRCDVIPRTAQQVDEKKVHTDDGPPVENAFSSPGEAQKMIASQNPIKIAKAIMPRTLSPEQVDLLMEQLGGESLPLTEEGFLKSPFGKLSPEALKPYLPPPPPPPKTVEELLALKPSQLTPEEAQIRRKAQIKAAARARAATKAAEKAGSAVGKAAEREAARGALEPLRSLSKLDYAAGDLAGVHIPSDETLIEGNNLNVRIVEERNGRRFYELSGKTTSGDLVEHVLKDRNWTAAGERQYWGTKPGTVLREGSAVQSRNFRPTDVHTFGNDRVRRFDLGDGRFAEFRVDQTRWFEDVWKQQDYSSTLDTAAAHSFRIRIPVSGDDAIDFAALRKVVTGTPLEPILVPASEEAQLRAGAIRWIVNEKKYFLQPEGYKLSNPWRSFPAGAVLRQADLWSATMEELQEFARLESVRDFKASRISIRKMAKLGYATTTRKLEGVNYSDLRVWHSIYYAGPEVAANILEEGRLVSSMNRMRIGLEGVLNAEDMKSGGADSVFFRIAHKSTAARTRFSTSFHGAGIQFIYKAEELERLDTYAFANDLYGRAYGRHMMSERLSIRAAIARQASENTAGNEIMFRQGVTLENLIEVRVGDGSGPHGRIPAQKVREQLLQILRDRGIREINGRKIEDVIKISKGLVSELWR